MFGTVPSTMSNGRCGKCGASSLATKSSRCEEEELNDRKIIWIKGAQGNEGKSWFQSYIQSLFGSHRVVRFDITNKTSDLLHIMSRCPLESHQRYLQSDDCCYSLLEMIKDGYASAPKFHGSLLRIKTPNLVIVFSNRNPHMLSKDRWKVYIINSDNESLQSAENEIWQKQTKPQATGFTEIYDHLGNMIKIIKDYGKQKRSFKKTV